MTKPLAGIKVVEVAMWAFVPSAGGVLSDMGADVVKVEPHGGDPIRALNTSGSSGAHGFTPSFEAYNRGKRSIALDLKAEGATDVLDRLLSDADVFLTSLLPAARRAMKIDVEDIQARHPNVIYALGSGHGAFGPEAEQGGYDFISFWGRAGVSSGVTPKELSYPLPMPSGAFGDCTSGAMLAGGVAAAIAHRAMTGKAMVVDVSLLAGGMWAMQSHITSALLQGVPELPKKSRETTYNPLVGTFRTSDDRFVTLCMLQSQSYWPGLCRVMERPELVNDPRFDTAENRLANVGECVRTLDEIFAKRTLEEWKVVLGRQDGQWGTVEKAGELQHDRQVQSNHYIQEVDYGDGRALKMVSVPMQFDRQALQARPAPTLGADSDAVLGELGYSEDEIIDLKVAGVIY